MRHQRRINDLRDRVTEMGRHSQSMVQDTLDSLDSSNYQAIQDDVMVKEGRLDQMQLDLDKEAVSIITMFNPVAHNLRFLLTATRVTSELERIGDQAVNICTYARISRPTGSTLNKAEEMGGLVMQMIENAIGSFQDEDAEAALETIVMDDNVDQYDREFSQTLLTDPSPLADRTTALLIAQALERIGDQATNICEGVIYAVNGQDVRHSPLLNLLNSDITSVETRQSPK